MRLLISPKLLLPQASLKKGPRVPAFLADETGAHSFLTPALLVLLKSQCCLFNEPVITFEKAGAEAKFKFIHVLSSTTGWGRAEEVRW